MYEELENKNKQYKNQNEELTRDNEVLRNKIENLDNNFILIHNQLEKIKNENSLLKKIKGSTKNKEELINKILEENNNYMSDEKFKYENIQGDKAIGCYPIFGPIFLGSQIKIYNNAFTKEGTTFEK